MLFVLLLASVLGGALSLLMGNQELADSLEWSRDSVQADLRAVVEQRLERFFNVDEYPKCVVSRELKLLDAAVKGLSDALGDARDNEDVAISLMELKGILDGNGRVIVESSDSMSGLLHFKSRFGDVLSMSLSFPGDQIFAKRVEDAQKKMPKLSRSLQNVKNIPTRMLESFDSFASAESCAANIRA